VRIADAQNATSTPILRLPSTPASQQQGQLLDTVIAPIRVPTGDRAWSGPRPLSGGLASNPARAQKPGCGTVIRPEAGLDRLTRHISPHSWEMAVTGIADMREEIERL